jgi:hypothetical protein
MSDARYQDDAFTPGFGLGVHASFRLHLWEAGADIVSPLSLRKPVVSDVAHDRSD